MTKRAQDKGGNCLRNLCIRYSVRGVAQHVFQPGSNSMKQYLLASAGLVALAGAYPAAAQNGDWTGAYIGGRVGYERGLNDSDATILFDNNRDGTFGDTINTAAGANAFSPGFCGGVPNSAVAADGCSRDDNRGITYGVNAGFDFDLGPIVLGALVEYDRSNIEDAVTAFSTTPANYVFNRELRNTFGVRGRLGLDAGSFLPYVTAGIVRAQIRNSFTSSNTVNAFALNDRSSREYGHRLGGGIETMVGPLAVGVLYLHTNVKDKDARVTVTQGTAPATNPFVLVNPNGTDFRRSDDRFKTHSLSLTASLRFGGRSTERALPASMPVQAPPPPPPPPAPATQTCPDGSVILATDFCPTPPPPPPPPPPAPERG